MSQSLARIYLHVVFSTKGHQRYLKRDICIELYDYISKVILESGSYVVKIGGCEDHLHVLVDLSKTESLSSLIEIMKKRSSKWIKTKGKFYSDFSWQRGYGGFSISQSNIDIVKKYIDNQEEHHKKVTFKDEFRMLLKKYNVSYDEKYVWD